MLTGSLCNVDSPASSLEDRRCWPSSGVSATSEVDEVMEAILLGRLWRGRLTLGDRCDTSRVSASCSPVKSRLPCSRLVTSSCSPTTPCAITHRQKATHAAHQQSEAGHYWPSALKGSDTSFAVNPLGLRYKPLIRGNYSKRPEMDYSLNWALINGVSTLRCWQLILSFIQRKSNNYCCNHCELSLNLLQMLHIFNRTRKRY